MSGLLQEEEALTLLSEAGYAKPLSLVTLADKRGILGTVLTFHLFIKVKAVMDQFKEGLEMAGILQYMEKYTDIIRPLFVDENLPLTASK